MKVYSAEVVELITKEQRKGIEDGIIVSEIREIKAFWPQFGVNLAGGFVSSLLFATLLVITTFLVFNNTSPSEIGAELRQQIEE